MKDRRMFKDYRDIGPAKKRQIDRHEKENPKDEVDIPEEVRVTHSRDNNPHDG